MKKQFPLVLVSLTLLAILNLKPSDASAQGTALTFQGRLNDNGNPAEGIYDMRFALYDAKIGGSQQGPVITTNNVTITNGLFTVTLDFGANFTGEDRWLEIGVRTNNAIAFATLSPRQKLTPTPYAITAGNVVSGGLTPGTYSSAVTFSNPGNSFNGSFVGNGSGLTGVNALTLQGEGPDAFWPTNVIRPNKFTTNANPEALKWTNMAGMAIQGNLTVAGTFSIDTLSAQTFTLPSEDYVSYTTNVYWLMPQNGVSETFNGPSPLSWNTTPALGFGNAAAATAWTTDHTYGGTYAEFAPGQNQNVIGWTYPDNGKLNYRFTGFWLATNSATISVSVAVTRLNSDGTINEAHVPGGDSFTYSLATNVVAHTSPMLTLPGATGSFIEFKYGIYTADSTQAAWLMGVKVEAW